MPTHYNPGARIQHIRDLKLSLATNREFVDKYKATGDYHLYKAHQLLVEKRVGQLYDITGEIL